MSSIGTISENGTNYKGGNGIVVSGITISATSINGSGGGGNSNESLSNLFLNLSGTNAIMDINISPYKLEVQELDVTQDIRIEAAWAGHQFTIEQLIAGQDAAISLDIEGGTDDWTFGIDNSHSDDAFCFSEAGTIQTAHNMFCMYSDGFGVERINFEDNILENIKYIDSDLEVRGNVNVSESVTATNYTMSNGASMSDEIAHEILIKDNSLWNHSFVFDFDKSSALPYIRTDLPKTAIGFDSNMLFRDQKQFQFGSSTDIILYWQAAHTYDYLRYAVSLGSAARSGYWVIGTKSEGQQYPRYYVNDPTLRVYSGDNTQKDDYIQISHDQDNARLDWGNGNLILNGSGYVGIGDVSPTYPLEVEGNVSGISIYAKHNISATGFITRTSVFDPSKNAFDYVKDSGYYLKNNKIDHKKFYGYQSWEVPDKSRPIINTKIRKVCDDEPSYYEETDSYEIICNDVEFKTTTYPYTEVVEGVSLDDEINVLRQAVYELSERVKVLEKRT